MRLISLLVFVGCIVRVQSQLGVTTCTLATQANCPNFLPNSYCNLATLKCECPTVAGYVDDGSGVECTYDCEALAAPVNGQVDTTQGTFTGDVATYICDATYKVNGAATSTCVADTGWDNTGTTCIAIEIGDDCSTNIFHCSNIANAVCQNFATCECNAGYEDDGTGLACTEINECITIAPCQNGGTCTDLVNDYSCACVAGYEDKECQTNIDECASNPCQNGGVCTDAINSFTCACAAGYEDDTCSTNINDCSPNPCQNGGLCLDGVNDYLCSCQAGYEGKDCDTNIDECASSPCVNGGTCVDGVNMYTCTCVAGYDGTNCQTNIDECATHQCENGATCVDGINLYTCTCVAGYNGNLCQNNINECLTHACQNGATCVDGIDDYSCLCVAGYNGDLCQTNIDECTPDPCENGGVCIDGINDYSCNCVDGYTDKNCQTNINECANNPCMNGGTCVDGINDYTCNCVAGYTDKNCQTNIDECENNICANGATCIDAINTYSCVCVPGYTDTYCLSNIDECVDHQCQNGGLCVDGIDSYTCECVIGYEGLYCQSNIDECAAHSCLNGATCEDGINGYSCTCVAGYNGEFCGTNINECEEHQCTNGATCVDGVNKYTCTCVAGYTGTLCETNIDECATDPCENGATCVDGINDYSCTCVPGYMDKNCQTNIDECAPAPCQNEATCVDGVNDYSCTCVAGYSGKDCGINIDECGSDPCQNGGTCVDGINRYTCNCVPGYNGDECENDIDECIGNVCENGATCVDGVNGYTCTCIAGYDGVYCGNDINECANHNCLNGATCIDGINQYSCLCVAGYADQYCNTNINECESVPCQNGGTCTDLVNGYTCTCGNGFTGLTCRAGVLGDDCSIRAEVCANLANAECAAGICACVSGFEDATGASGVCTRVDCRTINPPVNGAVDHVSEGTLYESKAYFTCNAGYTQAGLTSVTCQADGTWDGATPTCTIKDCGTVSTPLNGAVLYVPNTLYQGKAEFSCSIGYTLMGDNSRTCQDTGVWGSSNPTCQINDCGTLTQPSNGEVDLTDGTTYLSTIVFQCNSGYDLVGASSLQCQADSSWDAAKPVCVIKDCGFLSDPTNGVVDLSGGTTYLSEATFTCNTGYTLVGSIKRICQASGVWSGADPVCQINDCGVLFNPDNGRVDILAGTTYEETATYSCNAGFDLNGVLQRTCQADSTWSSAAPTCDRKNCGNLQPPTDGTVDLSGGTLFEATATFSCDPGYTLMGDATRYCESDGVWDSASPTCQIKDCGELTNPVDGQVLTIHGTTYSETAEYSCDAGYQVNGASTRECQTDGTWSASDPTCVILDCGPVADIVNGEISYSSGTIYGSTVSYSCDDGYEVTGVSSRVCQKSGTWSDSQPECTILDCDEATVIPNGVSRTPSGSQVGDEAIYECNPGYGLVGDPNVECLASGFWDTAPECRLDCGIPPTVMDGSVTYPDGTLVGATATYSCNDGYYISGISSIECLNTGSWTDEPFCFIILADYNADCAVTAQCVTTGSSCRDDGAGADRCLCHLTDQHYDAIIDECLADCGGLTAPTNGELVLPAVYSAGQIAVYSCDRGFSLTGPSTRTCLSSGQWNGTAPQCAEGCPNPEPPVNGQVQTTNGLTSGDTITYTCNVGYALIGAAERKCNADSTWSGSIPSCNIQCPELSNIKYGWVDLALGRWEGSKAVYVCENNYALVGVSTRTCQSSGLWDGVQPECVFAIFPDVILVFGSLFVFLVLVDVFILSFCLYLRYFKNAPKPPKFDKFDDISKKNDGEYPGVFDEEKETGVPPAAFPHATKEHKQKKAQEREERRNRPAKVAPETTREILRMETHPPPIKGPNVRIEKKPYLGFGKPDFLRKAANKWKRPQRADKKVDDVETDRSKFEEVQFTPIEKPEPPPNSVQQQAMRDLREHSSHNVHVMEDLIRDGGYGTANSDDSHNKLIFDEDQLSLDDLTPAEPLEVHNSTLSPKPSKAPVDEFTDKFYGRVPLPQMKPTQHGYREDAEKNENGDESPEKPYTDKERRHLKTTVNTYSPIFPHNK